MSPAPLSKALSASAPASVTWAWRVKSSKKRSSLGMSARNHPSMSASHLLLVNGDLFSQNQRTSATTFRSAGEAQIEARSIDVCWRLYIDDVRQSWRDQGGV